MSKTVKDGQKLSETVRKGINVVKNRRRKKKDCQKRLKTMKSGQQRSVIMTLHITLYVATGDEYFATESTYDIMKG